MTEERRGQHDSVASNSVLGIEDLYNFSYSAAPDMLSPDKKGKAQSESIPLLSAEGFPAEAQSTRREYFVVHGYADTPDPHHIVRQGNEITKSTKKRRGKQ